MLASIILALNYISSYLSISFVASLTLTLGFFPPLSQELGVWLTTSLNVRNEDHVNFNAEV